MPHFLVQWKFNPSSFETMRKNPLDRYATSVKLADAFKGSIVSLYNRMGEYDGLGIFTFPDVIHATAHSVHAMATGERACSQAVNRLKASAPLLSPHEFGEACDTAGLR